MTAVDLSFWLLLESGRRWSCRLPLLCCIAIIGMTAMLKRMGSLQLQCRLLLRSSQKLELTAVKPTCLLQAVDEVYSLVEQRVYHCGSFKW